MIKGWKKQFCIHGHDTFITGRYLGGKCIVCAKSNPTQINTQFCVNGHNMHETGKTKNNLCRLCEKMRFKKYKEDHKEEIKAQSQEYYMINKSDFEHRSRVWNLKHKYGITIEDYNKLFNQQNGKCAGCLRSPEEVKSKFLDIDHDHATGKVRGLLCRDCNTSLGKLLNNPNTLRRLADYVQVF